MSGAVVNLFSYKRKRRLLKQLDAEILSLQISIGSRINKEKKKENIENLIEDEQDALKSIEGIIRELKK